MSARLALCFLGNEDKCLILSLTWFSVVSWSQSSPHVALTAIEEPTRLWTSEIEDNFMFSLTHPPNKRFLFKLPVVPGCQNDLHRDDPWSRSCLSTENTCSGVGMGYYLPISTLACNKSIRHMIKAISQHLYYIGYKMSSLWVLRFWIFPSCTVGIGRQWRESVF